MRIIVTLLVVGFFSLCSPAFAQGKVLGLLELRNAVLSDDKVLLKSAAYSNVPTGASFATTDLYSQGILGAALKFGDIGRAEEIARNWVKANTGNLTAKSALFSILARGTGVALEEAAKLGAEFVALSDFDRRVRSRQELAHLYLNIGEFAKAETLLVEAEKLIRNELSQYGLRGNWAFWVPNTKAGYFKTRCTQHMMLYQFKKAEGFCIEANELIADAIKNRGMVNSIDQTNSLGSQIEQLAILSSVYIKTGRFFDAATGIKRANDLLANGAPSYAKGWVLEAEVELATAKGDADQMAILSKLAEKTKLDFNASEASIRFVIMRKNEQTARLVTGNWQAAQKAFDYSDGVIANSDAYVKQTALHIISRSLTYLMSGNEAKLLVSLDAELKKSAALLGEEHPQTGLLRGLLALVLDKTKTGPSNSTLVMLDQAVSTLTSATSLSGDFFNQTDHPIARRMIFEKFIELAGNSTDARFSGKALGIADSLRNSAVQSAMNDAAVRAAAATPQLAALIRSDQDAKNELRSLYNFLANGSSQLEAKRLDSVAAQMKSRIAELEKVRAELDVVITKQFAEYKKLTNPQPPSLTDIANNLAPSEALLTLLPTDKHVYVWAVRVDGSGKVNQKFVKVDIDNSQLGAMVKRLRASLDVAGLPAARRPAFDHLAAQTLYQSLVAPVQSALDGKTSLIVAAGGLLGQIPFGVLQTAAGNSNADFANASWLIKKTAVTHVPSVAAWLTMRALPHRSADQALMAWGDPLFNLADAGAAQKTAQIGEVRKVALTRASTTVDLEKEAPRSALKYANITALPETRDELFAIAKALGADANKDLLLGLRATRESVLEANKSGELAKRRVIAFATHGLIAGDLPNLTQPALAMTSTKDAEVNVLAPLLTLEDVLGLKINADWVVLSACNTAAADGKAEEALSGLARGFFYAGSRSLLVTHWAVDSDSAVTLTTETFKHNQNNPAASKAESLRQAMLGVMNTPATSHPTYWAPYALVGDGAR